VNAATGAIAANYEYGPFGELIRATGPMAQVNPFTFQTELYDWETSKYYWKCRYYDPSSGRWIGRDPAEEDGGLNLYGFCGNDAVDFYDVLGLVWTVDRQWGNRATATPQNGDTVAGLAAKISLNADEFTKWLKPVGPTAMPSSPNTPITSCSQFTVPNTAYIDQPDLGGGIGGAFLYAAVTPLALGAAPTLLNHGVNVIYDHGSQVNANVITGHMAHDNLWMYFYFGHGNGSGGLVSADDVNPFWNVNPAKFTQYGIAYMSLIGCGTKGMLFHDPWAVNVSLPGWLILSKSPEMNIIELYSLDNLSKEHGTAP
jgi:RHS repeat-associated protein